MAQRSLTSTAATIAGVILTLAADPAAAAAPAEKQGWSPSAGLRLSSDHRFRGVSLSNHRPALQAKLGLQHGSGFFGEAKAANIVNKEGRAALKWGATTGLRRAIGPIVLGGDVAYIGYRGKKQSDFVEFGVRVAAGRGRWKPALEWLRAPRQSGLADKTGRARSKSYLRGGIEVDLDKSTALQVSAGHERGAFSSTQSGGKNDWSIELRRKWKGLGFELAYVGTDRDIRTADGRNLGRDGLVLAVGMKF